MKWMVNKMAKIYVRLILKGKKSFEEVPERLKKQVKRILIEYQMENLTI